MVCIRPFRDWSIRHKLTGLFIAMACITAIAVAVTIATFDLWSLKAAMARDLETLADVLARNSTAALAFSDADAARDVLQALQAEPSVTAACIYTQNGKEFATFIRPTTGSASVPPFPQPPATRFEHGRLIQFRKIMLDGEPVGTIFIESDLRRLNAKLREYTIAVFATLLLTLSLAFVIASRLQRPISRPLGCLVKTAEAISGAADYSIRADLPNRDEFGLLVSAFNGMLDQIEARDHELRQHRGQLEQEVASRTGELLAMNARLKLQAAALEAAADSIVITDIEGAIVWTNPSFSILSGYTSEEVRGSNFLLQYSSKRDGAFHSQIWSAIMRGETWRGEIANYRKDGSAYMAEMTITPVSLHGSGVSHFVAITQDISIRKQAEESLRQAEEKYRAIFEDAVVGIFQITPEGRPLSINRALAHMHGYDSPEQLVAEVSNIASELLVDSSQLREMLQVLDKNGVVSSAELEVYRRDRTKKFVLVNMRAVRDVQHNIVRLEGTVEDITDRKLAEERVEFLAYYDALTELPNRTLLRDRIAQALAVASRRKNKVALLFLDLDRFKVINDSLGHSFGDLLLKKVAQRLKKQAREQDTVARIGGDEFLVVLTGIKEPAEAAIAAERILNVLTTQFTIQGHSFSVSCSIGISIFPEHGFDGESLIKNADAALYCAKESGRNMFRFFTDDMNAQVMERLTLENGLRLALEQKQFSLVYQPQIELATGRIVGVEALIRWQHPELGFIPPDKFIPVAENCGLIIPIGEWVLRSACKQARLWQDNGLRAVPIAVNVSAVQFRPKGFCELIRAVLDETGLSPQSLELELTETVLLSNADMMFLILQELKAMGVKLAIDDFGTGYSSLSYLRQFPVGKLKIDRSFIQDVAVNPDSASIATAIISLAKGLNLKVIAEGVENEGQMSFLRAHQCDEIQGYFFSKPLTADEMTEKLGTAAACLSYNQQLQHDEVRNNMGNVAPAGPQLLPSWQRSRSHD